MALEHQVWSVPPNRTRRVLDGCYELHHWQFAEKRAAMLEDKGHTLVEVTTADEDECGDDGEDDD